MKAARDLQFGYSNPVIFPKGSALTPLTPEELAEYKASDQVDARLYDYYSEGWGMTLIKHEGKRYWVFPSDWEE